MSNESKPPEATASARAFRAIEIVVKAAALGVPVLYVLGRAFQEAFWNELHLSVALMGYSGDDYLYSGFLAIVLGLGHMVGANFYSTIGKAVVIGVSIGACYTVVIWLEPLLLRRLKTRAAIFRERFQEASKKNRTGYLGLQSGAVLGAGLSTLFVFLACLTVIFFLPFVFAVNSGTIQGKLERDRQLGRLKSAPPMYVDFRQGEVLQTAPFVACGEAWCVIFQQGTFVAIPKSEVVRIGPQRPAKMQPGSRNG